MHRPTTTCARNWSNRWPSSTAHFGRRPVAIIWPGGGFAKRPVEFARAAGYRVGFTINPRGPLMFNWIPQAQASDPMRPVYLPEGPAGDPLLTLPRYWPSQVSGELDSIRLMGKEAAAHAEANKATELAYYDIVCAADHGTLPSPEHARGMARNSRACVHRRIVPVRPNAWRAVSRHASAALGLLGDAILQTRNPQYPEPSSGEHMPTGGLLADYAQPKRHAGAAGRQWTAGRAARRGTYLGSVARLGGCAPLAAGARTAEGTFAAASGRGLAEGAGGRPSRTVALDRLGSVG